MKQNGEILTELDNLLMSSIDYKKEDIALRLLTIGYDPNATKEVFIELTIKIEYW